MLAVVGLGNPGPTYAGHRHNIGFRVVAACRQRWRLPAFVRQPLVEVSRGRLRDRSLLLARPQTYMNRSGGAVEALLNANALTPAELLVVLDDVYLPLGRLRLRAGGGDGGHNGLRSIAATLGTGDFARLRFGVGAPAGAGELREHVLDDFSPAEEDPVRQALDTAVEAVAAVVLEDIGEAMNRFNVAPPEVQHRSAVPDPE